MIPIDLQLDALLRVGIAALLGGAVGFERQITGKRAGLRTHMLVAIGAALLVSTMPLLAVIAEQLAPDGPAGNFRLQIDPLATVQAVATGIGFLGAGTLFLDREAGFTRGLTTAASIWVTAAIGVAVGIGAYLLGIGATALVLIVLHLLPRLDRAVASVKDS